MPFLYIDTTRVQTLTPEEIQSSRLPKISESQQMGSATEKSIDDEHENPYSNAASGSDLKLEQGLTAMDVMSCPVATLMPNQTVQQAIELLLTKSYQHIPITTDQEELVGILSIRDLISWIHKHKNIQSWSEIYQTAVSEIMVHYVLTATEDTDIRLVAQVMSNHAVGSLPIIKRNRENTISELVGIITKSDIFPLIIDAVAIDSWT